MKLYNDEALNPCVIDVDGTFKLICYRCQHGVFHWDNFAANLTLFLLISKPFLRMI